MNKVTGEKVIKLDGKVVVLRYTWRAIAEIEEKHGDMPNLFEAEVVASIAAIGLREKQPEYTAERIMELSPPLIPFAKDVQEALQWAYFGKETPPDSEESQKKSHLKGGWWKRLRRR
jgi:hypothetical protein